MVEATTFRVGERGPHPCGWAVSDSPTVSEAGRAGGGLFGRMQAHAPCRAQFDSPTRDLTLTFTNTSSGGRSGREGNMSLFPADGRGGQEEKRDLTLSGWRRLIRQQYPAVSATRMGVREGGGVVYTPWLSWLARLRAALRVSRAAVRLASLRLPNIWASSSRRAGSSSGRTTVEVRPSATSLRTE